MQHQRQASMIARSLRRHDRESEMVLELPAPASPTARDGAGFVNEGGSAM